MLMSSITLVYSPNNTYFTAYCSVMEMVTFNRLETYLRKIYQYQVLANKNLLILQEQAFITHFAQAHAVLGLCEGALLEGLNPECQVITNELEALWIGLTNTNPRKVT